MAYEIATIGGLGHAGLGDATTPSDPAQAAADQIFAGCGNRTEIAAFLAAMAFERYTKGLGLGLAIGAVGGAVALYYWSQSRKAR